MIIDSTGLPFSYLAFFFYGRPRDCVRHHMYQCE